MAVTFPSGVTIRVAEYSPVGADSPVMVASANCTNVIYSPEELCCAVPCHVLSVNYYSEGANSSLYCKQVVQILAVVSGEPAEM